MAAIAWGALLGTSHLAGKSTVLDRLESLLLDLRFLLAGPRPPPMEIVIVALDDDTVQRVGRYPFPRGMLAQLIRSVDSHRPKAIAVDVLFLDPGDSNGDATLALALEDARAVIAAGGLLAEGPKTVRPGHHPLSGVPRLRSVLWPVRPIGDAAAIGLVNISTDHGGTPRHLPLVMQLGNVLIPSFALRTAARAVGTDPQVLPGRLQIGRVTSITDFGANLPLRFYGPRGTVRTISASLVLSGEIPDGALRDQVVVIGVTALGTSDTFNTPFDSVLPGVEVLATGIGHLVSGDGLVRGTAVRRADAVLAIVLPTLAILLLSLRRVGLGLLLLAGMGTIWIIVVLVAFRQGVWLSMSVPLAAVVPPAAAYMGIRLWIGRRVEQKLDTAQDTLRRFHPPALARNLVVSPAYLESPVQQYASVLFIDLSGFTGASERLGPERTRALLKDFHLLIEREVTANGGLVLSYLGDGAMILFGLLEPKQDDARRALRTAVSLVREACRWLHSLSLDVQPTLGVRVGAHWGPVVLSRLGGEQHQQITVAGDSVNVASRLLEVAAGNQVRLVVSDDLYRAAGMATDEAESKLFGSATEIRVRGRSQPAMVRFAQADEDDQRASYPG